MMKEMVGDFLHCTSFINKPSVLSPEFIEGSKDGYFTLNTNCLPFDTLRVTGTDGAS
ncbi:MAG TPA: hypothetical protein VGA95_09520 [Thermodesulfobacteriota bacterium]